MSITIKNLPYDGLSSKINPVYNGLGFVVDSNFKSLNNFKYIAEIFVEGSKVGELRHNPDISSNNYGIFDIGRVVESYLSYDLNWDKNITLAPTSLVKYYVRFGEEFSRVISIKSYSNSGGKIKIKLNSQHSLENGDAILVQGISGGLYNGEFANEYTTVTKSGTTDLILNDIPYQADLNVSGGFILCGETVNSFVYWTDSSGNKKVRLKVKKETSFNEGDMVYITQPVFNNSYRNVEWTIERKTTYSTYSYLDISCPHGTDVIPTLKGTIVSRDNYVYYNKFSTQNHQSRAFNGVEQYENWLDWDPAQYLFTSTSGKFLTKRPDRTLNVCLDDWMTLSLFGRKEMTDFNLEAPEKVIVETWQDPITPVSEPIDSYISASVSGKPNRLSIKVTPNIVGFLYPGDYVDITTDTAGTIRARVITYSYSALVPAGTTVILDYDFDPLEVYNTFTLVIHAINNTYTYQSDRFDMGAGPKNLNLPEINDGSAYKYFIYNISTSASTSNFWLWDRYGETWTFNLNCSCSKFKKWTLVWLNELGGFDFYNFDKRSDKFRNVERDQFRRHLKSYSTSGYKYKMGDRGRTNYNVRSKDTIELRTGFLNQEYIDWLQFAFESPEVYIIDLDTNKILPVNCVDNDIELYNKTNFGDNGTLYTYKITLEMANNRTIQRGGNINKVSTETPGSGSGSGGTGPFNPGWNTWNNGIWDQFNRGFELGRYE